MTWLETPDISREGFTVQKWTHFLRVLFSKEATRTLGAYNEFSDIDFVKLWDSGKRWIILDIDECVAPHHGDILPVNLAKIMELKNAWWEIAIFSNMKKSDRYADLEKVNIPVITSRYAKPDPRWFQDCLSTMQIFANNAVMIGDNYLTDGWSISNWIDFIKVRPIATEDRSKKLGRNVQILVRELVDTIAKARWNLNYK